MKKHGVTWLVAQKGPGSRKNGWEQLRNLLKAAAAEPREERGIFIFDTCEHWKRTVPVLPRSDKDLDDIDTEADDHLADASRYRIFRKKSVSDRRPIRGR
jgi:hypothetical protein